MAGKLPPFGLLSSKTTTKLQAPKKLQGTFRRQKNVYKFQKVGKAPQIFSRYGFNLRLMKILCKNAKKLLQKLASTVSRVYTTQHESANFSLPCGGNLTLSKWQV